jgi:hypothetical protein
MKKMGKRGGLTTASRMTAAQRTERARLAVEERERRRRQRERKAKK